MSNMTSTHVRHLYDVDIVLSTTINAYVSVDLYRNEIATPVQKSWKVVRCTVECGGRTCEGPAVGMDEANSIEEFILSSLQRFLAVFEAKNTAGKKFVEQIEKICDEFEQAVTED